MKKVLSIVIVLLMVITLVPMSAAAGVVIDGPAVKEIQSSYGNDHTNIVGGTYDPNTGYEYVYMMQPNDTPMKVTFGNEDAKGSVKRSVLLPIQRR